MIILPTRRRLERRRDALYDKLYSTVLHASIQQVEDVMRKIHIINLRLVNYFIKANEPREIFTDEDPVETQNTLESQTFQGREELLRYFGNQDTEGESKPFDPYA